MRATVRVIDGGLPTAIRYRDVIVYPIVTLFAGAIGDDFVLMHDHAHPMVASMVQEYMKQA